MIHEPVRRSAQNFKLAHIWSEALRVTNDSEGLPSRSIFGNDRQHDDYVQHRDDPKEQGAFLDELVNLIDSKSREHHDRRGIRPKLVGSKSANQSELYRAMQDKEATCGNSAPDNRSAVVHEEVRYQIGGILFQFSLN